MEMYNKLDEKYRSVLSTQADTRKSLDNVYYKITKLKSKTNKMLESIYNKNYNYELGEIIQYIDIRDNTKQKIMDNVERISIFRQDKNTIIMYNYLIWKYKFVIDEKYALKISKDDTHLFVYDLIKEFRPLHFNNIDKPSVIENYIDLFIKNDNIKLGMIVSVYFYIVTYLKDITNSENKEIIMDSRTMQKFVRLFNNISE